MPLFTIGHSCELTSKQEDELAQSITKIHAEKFNTPYLFVNVIFENLSKKACFVGGKRTATNIIMADYRINSPKGSRSQAQLDEVLQEIKQEWEKIIGREGVYKLRVVGIKANIASIMEAGIVIPVIGEEEEWANEYMPEFQKLAEMGDEDMKNLIADIKERKLYGI